MTAIANANFALVLLSLMAVTCSHDRSKVVTQNPPTVSDLTIGVKKRDARGTPKEILYYLGLLTTGDHALFDEQKVGGGGGATGLYTTYNLDNIVQGLRLHFEYCPVFIPSRPQDEMDLVTMIELYRVDKNGKPEDQPITRTILERPNDGG
jgi:hypothetical protein